MKILVLGASGMIGSTVVKVLARNKELSIAGTIRTESKITHFHTTQAKWITGVDLSNNDRLTQLFFDLSPNIVINCAGLTKHLPEGNEPIPALTLNALLPHRIAALCKLTNARFIHISTDCVFSGKKGRYTETDQADAEDIYGKTKYLGEVTTEGALTLRTSTIGHEIGTKFGLLEWFLLQKSCRGFRKAIFSGLPTLELARVIRDIIIPNPSLCGLYHIGAAPINKDTLLRLIASIYGIQVDICADDTFVIDRSLDSAKFLTSAGYTAPDWPVLIENMYKDFYNRYV
jgi:dTDP-4-dehydrorhamnose reductase